MNWLTFLKKYAKKHNMKLGDAMKPAAKEWKKMKKTGGGDEDASATPENASATLEDASATPDVKTHEDDKSAKETKETKGGKGKSKKSKKCKNNKTKKCKNSRKR
jgi:hypothetical protein